MLAGDAGSLAPNSRTLYQCQQGGPGKGPEDLESAFPTYPCLQFLRALIEFPSCWDGINLDLPDHKSHMSYPNGDGKCDPGHPYHLPLLSLELGFDTKDVDPASWVLSTGSKTGGGLHADFFNGWNRTILQAAMRDPTCMDRENIFEDGGPQCLTLKPFKDTPKQDSCRLAAPIPKELVGFPAPIPSLPGCNLPWSTGVKPTCSAPIPTPIIASADSFANFQKSGGTTLLAVAANFASNTTTISKATAPATSTPATTTSPSTSFATPTAISNYIYKGCYNDSSIRAFTGYKQTNDAILTLEKCAALCSPLLYFAVENGTPLHFPLRL
jgi:hypothetical protein